MKKRQNCRERKHEQKRKLKQKQKLKLKQKQELKYNADMKGMNVIYWLLSLFGVRKDVIEDEEVYLDYLRGYGWMKPHSTIPSERFPEEERTKERLEWMKENDVEIV